MVASDGSPRPSRTTDRPTLEKGAACVDSVDHHHRHHRAVCARLLRPRQVPPLEASRQHDRKEEFVPGKFVVKPGTTGKYRFNLLSRRDT